MTDNKRAQFVVIVGDVDHSHLWGCDPLRFVCREHLANAEPRVIASAEPVEGTPVQGVLCEAEW